MLASWRLALVLFFTASLSFLSEGARGQPFVIGPATTSDTATPETTAATPSPATARAENAAQLQAALRKLEAAGATDNVAAQEVAFYQTREAVLTQHEAVEQQIKDLTARKTELESQLKSPSAADSQSYNFAELDRLKDDLASEQARLNLAGDKLATTKANLEKAHLALEEAEVKQRQTRAEGDAAKGKPNHGELNVVAEQARLAALLAKDTLELRKRELARDTLAEEVQTLLVTFRKEQVARMSPRVVMTLADYQEQLDEIKKKEDAATDRLKYLQEWLQTTNQKLREAQEQYDAATGDRTLQTENLESERRAREKLTDEIDCLTQRLQRLAQLRVAWGYRFKISKADVNNPDVELWSELKERRKETKGIIGGLTEDLRSEILRMRDLRSSLTAVNKKIEAVANAPAELQLAVSRQRDKLELTLRVHERNLVMIESARRVHEKLLDEIGAGVETLTPKNLALGAWHRAAAIWKFELATINGVTPVTIKTVVQGIVLFLGGWLSARFLSTMFANRLLKRFRMSRDATTAIRSLVFYLLLAIFFLQALRTIGIPLTAFTILGGALAIGVGFGSQALINNFIGGLIMLAERPVRLGERVSFKDFDGVVEDVGFRCTKLRTGSDHLVTIPNSTLVNESIENVDRRRTIRRAMNIQVTYNVTRDLMAAAVQAIRDILEEKEIRERIHPIVGFEELPPRVFFTDYNAESLNIQVTYWYAPVDHWAFMEHCERVNFRIMEEFDRLGIEFAFPSKTTFVKTQTKRDVIAHAA